MLTATLLALASAVCHATWSLIVKVSGDRDAATMATWLIGGLVALPVLVIVGLPDVAAWPYLGAAALIQILYAFGLSRAYTHGDFSLAYPVARGSGALLVALVPVGAFVLGALAVDMLLSHEQLVIERGDVVSAALDQFRAKPRAEFSDCLMLEIARSAGHLPLGTFDKPLSRRDGAELLR